jgi:hypothetical protein
MSAYSQLQGLFPIKFGPKIKESDFDIAVPPVRDYDFTESKGFLKDASLPYYAQAIPIHVVEKGNEIYGLERYLCNGFNEAYYEDLKKDVITDGVKEFKDKYGDQLKKAISIDEFTFATVHDLCDIYITDFFHRRELKSLKSTTINLSEMYTDCKHILHLALFEANLGDTHLGVISFSPLFRLILSYMDNRITNEKEGVGYTQSSPKLLMLSGHDTNIATLEAFFKSVFSDYFKEYIFPEFAASVYLELHQNDLNKDEYFVATWFNSDMLFNVTYNEFKDRVVKNLVDSGEINTFCGKKENVPPSSTSMSVLIAIIVILALVIVGYLVYRWRLKKKMDQRHFEAMKNDIPF